MDSFELFLLGLLLAPFVLWAVCIFVLRLCGVVRWSLLLCPPLWGVMIGSAGAFLGFHVPSRLHLDSSGFGRPADSLESGIIATLLGTLAGCVYAFMRRQRSP